MEKASTILLILILTVSTVPIIIKTPKVVANSGATLELVNPTDGTHLFNFTASQKAVNDTFLINVIVNNASDLFSWQIHVMWDPTLLEFSKIDKAGTVFEGKTIVEALDTSTPGHVVYGQALFSPPGVNVTIGKLCGIELKIIKGVSILEPKVECDLNITALGTDTFLLNSQGLDIPIDSVTNAYYIYQWVKPALKPRFYLSPSTIKPAKLGDTFTVDVMIADVDAAWEIIAVQFSIMWNTTLIEPAEPYWAKGTFFEAFNYTSDGIIYAVDINTHARPPPMTPIPDDYNYSTIGILLLPDPNPPYNYTYHPPYPSGSGKLATLYFKAAYETSFPVIASSLIEFITYYYPDGSSEDMLVLNKYGMDIGYSSAEPSEYRAPIYCNRVSHTVIVDGQSFTVITCSNGEIAPNSVIPLKDEKALQFNVTGEAGTAGFVNITIPKTLLDGNPSNWAVYINGETASATITGNETHNFVYIEFTFTELDTVKIVGTWIVPEFPGMLLLLIPLTTATFLASIKLRKRKK